MITSTRYAGTEHWLGDGCVRFDEDGTAVGVVRDGAGRVIDPPASPGPSQYAAARASQFCDVDGDAPDSPPEPADEETAPEAPEEAPQAQEPAPDASDEDADEGEDQQEAAGADLPDLEAMSRGELWAMVKDLGLDVEFTGTPNDEFREAIRGHWRAEGLIE